MKRQRSNTIYGLKLAMEKNDFERLKSGSGKKQNDFVANPINLKLNYFCFKNKRLFTKAHGSQIYCYIPDILKFPFLSPVSRQPSKFSRI